MEAPPTPSNTLSAQRAGARRRRIAAAAVVAVIVFAAVGAAVWFLHSDESATSTTTTSTPTTSTPQNPPLPAVAPRIVSVALLRRFAGASGRPVYWAGERRGARLEYTRRNDGATFVRYLTGNAKPGNGNAGYIVVATYAQPDAYKRVSTIASRQHLAVKRIGGGGIAVTRKGRPQNIYVVYPDQPYQVEVYAPTAAEARHLVLTGAIEPIS